MKTLRFLLLALLALAIALPVTLVLLIQVLAAAALLARPWGFVTLGVLVCLSRTALLIACAAPVPAARPSGLGATVAGVVPRSAAVVGLVLAAGGAAAATIPTGSPAGST